MRIILFLGFLSCVYSAPKKLPKDWSTCSRNDPNLNECLKPKVQDAIMSLLPGSQSLGVLPLEPLHFQYINIDQPGNGPVALNLSFYDIDLSNVKSLKVDKIEADWSKPKMKIMLHLDDPLILTGGYSIDGKVLILPIAGNGKANLTFVGFKANLTLDGKIMKKGNEEYFDVTKAAWDLDTTRLYTYFGNLFNGDKALGDNMNRFLNENWMEILNELKGSISRAYGEAFRMISNQVFKKLPLSTIAPV